MITFLLNGSNVMTPGHAKQNVSALQTNRVFLILSQVLKKGPYISLVSIWTMIHLHYVLFPLEFLILFLLGLEETYAFFFFFNHIQLMLILDISWNPFFLKTFFMGFIDILF